MLRTFLCNKGLREKSNYKITKGVFLLGIPEKRDNIKINIDISNVIVISYV